MTQPTGEKPATPSGGGGYRGQLTAGPGLTGPPQVPKMDDEQLRLRCVELAITALADGITPTTDSSVVTGAESFYTYIKGGNR